MSGSQKGNALIVVIIVIVVAIFATLGFVIWQNFLTPKTATVISETTKDDTSAPIVKDETFTSDKYGVTFTYPSGWTVKQVVADDSYAYVRTYTVQKTEDDVLTLSVGVQGLGGTCDFSEVRSNNVLEAEPVSIKSQKPATLSYIVYEAEGSFVGAYGLTDYYTEVKDSPSCPNVFYMYIPATNSDLYLVGFGGSKKFASFEKAEQFKDSDTYKDYKKIISSLTYED